MPSTKTITAYVTFAPDTEVKSAGHNTNFGNYRGHIIPIDPNTIATTDLTHDLGGATERWANAYAQDFRGARSRANPWPTVSTITSDYSVTSNDGILFANCSTAGLSITLLGAASVTGQMLTIKKEGTDANTLTISAVENIDDTTSVSFTNNDAIMQIVSDGSIYRTIFKTATISEWIAFTPTGSWTSNTTYTGLWRRVGDSMDIEWKWTMSGAPNAVDLLLNMPSGFLIDTSKLTASTNHPLRNGGSMKDAGDPHPFDLYLMFGSTSHVIVRHKTANTTNVETRDVTTIAPFTWASGDFGIATATVPIVGW